MRWIPAVVVALAACVPQPPPPPANLPRISVQGPVCAETWQNLPPPFGDGKSYDVFYWKWSTVDGPAHVQVEDVTNKTVAAVVDIPAGGGTYWQRFASWVVGRIAWLHDGGWTPVALFPGSQPRPHTCGPGEHPPM